MRVVSGAPPSGRLVVVPHSADGDGEPLPQNWLRIVQMLQADCDLYQKDEQHNVVYLDRAR